MPAASAVCRHGAERPRAGWGDSAPHSGSAICILKDLDRPRRFWFEGRDDSAFSDGEGCWAPELVKLGHAARLMPPNYVKAYVRRQKNDAADAAAICEAVGRPSMRFVPIRSIGNQAILMHHKVRELLVSQRLHLLNGLCGHLEEGGFSAP